MTPFTLYRYDHNSDKYSSLALCIRKNIHIISQEYFVALNAVRFTISSDNNIEKTNLCILLVYRKNNSSILEFVNGIDYLLRSNDVDIILGDFNINYFNNKDMEPLTLLMESLHYVQIVKIPTFISGSLLDHIYIKEANKANVDNSVISVYYSDHDAVGIRVTV